MQMWYTYILQSKKNGRYYIGSTDNYHRRFEEHNTGKVKSTRYIRPLILVYKETYKTRKEASKREAYLKKMKSKKYIEWLMNKIGD